MYQNFLYEDIAKIKTLEELLCLLLRDLCKNSKLSIYSFCAATNIVKFVPMTHFEQLKFMSKLLNILTETMWQKFVHQNYFAFHKFSKDANFINI